MQKRSYLCFEDDAGNSDWIGAPQLKKLLHRNEPAVLALNGRTHVQIGVRDPYHTFALECVQLGFMAALAIPAAMHADSIEILNRVFFNGLGAGQTVCESVSDVRTALIEREVGLRSTKRFDWGTPACYIGAECGQPVAIPSETLVLEHGTVLPGADQQLPQFVGRKNELRNLRKALKEKVSVIYLWGRTGAGKSTLIDQFLHHTGVQLKGVLRVQCDAIREPLSVLSKIASFWAGHDPAEHQQAADLLLDSRQDPFVRAQAAQEHLGQYRYLLIFENIDVWFHEPDTEASSADASTIAYPLIRSVFLGMLNAQANTTVLFTGERRWVDLSSLPSADCREIPLPLLRPRLAYALMSGLPGLNTASRQTMDAVYWHLGGHPLAIKLLSGWRLSHDDHDLDLLFQDPPVPDRSTAAWITYLLGDIIDHLDPGEAQVLPITAILNRPISATALPNLTLISAPYAGALLNTWMNAGLIQMTAVKGQYTFHQTVRNFILDRISTNAYRQLHLQAAEYYGAPFMDEARRQIYARNAGYQSEERVTWLARDLNGILGAWLRQEQDKERHQELLDLAMSWQYHLFHAGEFEAAVQIARAIVPVLHRLGLRDLAGAMLQRAISTAEGYDRTAGMDDFARIQIADGHLVGALNVYEEVYKALLSHGTPLQ
ncbi:MAG: ATP-binding protein, partial [Anaerolineales bacterium]